MKFLIPITYGSELRQFYHSGLVELLIKHDHEIFALVKDMESGIELEINTKVKILKFPKDNHLGYFFNIVHQALNYSNKSSFQFDPLIQKKGFKGFFYNVAVNLFSILAKNNFLKKNIQILESKLAINQSKKEWIELLKTLHIDIILHNVPNINLACIASSKKLKIRNYLIFHTNKDLQSIERLILPFDKYGVWSHHMKKNLNTKFNIPVEKIEIVGNLHLSFLMKDHYSEEKEFHSKPHFLYICGALNISNEELILRKVIQIFERAFDNNYTLTVRKNPMEIRDVWEKYESKQVTIHTPDWYYNRKRNYNFARKKDLSEFKNQLEQADAVIGFPSSVIMEANISGKDFLNLLIDDDQIMITNTNSSPSVLWNNVLYDSIKKHHASINIFCFSDFENFITNYPKPKNHFNFDYMKEEFEFYKNEELLETNLHFLTC